MRHAICLAVFACSGSCSAHDRAPEPAKVAKVASVANAPAPVVAPGLRLPEGVVPLAYDLQLELDPESATFRGHVTIRIALAGPTDHFWIHAEDLDIEWASYDDGATSDRLEAVPVAGDQMRAFRFDHVIAGGQLAIHFDYTGRTQHDQQGLFRQREGGRSYLFSQSEAVFARQILPCFDEPRFKVPWRVTLVVPKDEVALANMPQIGERGRADGRREVAFGVTPPMASYQLAVAVGPFELVELGALGRGQVPVRVAALAGQRDHVGVVRAKLPAIVAAAEELLEGPLPLAKLDLVIVPQFFGAMENPGLVTIEEIAVVGDERQPVLAERFVKVAAHEVVHMWFGNLVTPAWWDDLWLAEAFASWLGDRIAEKVGAFADPCFHFALARREALAADAEPDAKPLRRKIEHNEDPDNSFDSIAYEKGQAVLETFSRTARWHDGLRRFLADHRQGTATTADLVAALGGEPLGGALVGYIDHTGVPVVDLALQCNGKTAVLDAHARDGLVVPVCARYGDKSESNMTCQLVGNHAAIALLGGSCPTWVAGNSEAGYYEVAWTLGGPLGPLPPFGKLSHRAQIAAGDDVVAALYRGEVTARDALAALRTLAQTKDPYAQLAAAGIARALDPFVPVPTRAAWGKWLAAAFAARLSPSALLYPHGPIEHALRDELAWVVPPSALPPATVRRVARELDRSISLPGAGPEPALAAIAAPIAGHVTFEHIVQIARANHDPAIREAALDALGRFGGDQLAHTLELYLTANELPASSSWLAVAGYLARTDTRDAAWHAVHARLSEIVARMPAEQVPGVIAATAELCDATARSEVATAFTPRLQDVPNGRHELDRALAAIDRCVTRRARVGDIAAALRN